MERGNGLGERGPLASGEPGNNYLTKGKQVYVEGRLQTRSWDDKDGKKQYMAEVKGSRAGDAWKSGRGGDGGGQEAGPQPVSMPRSAPRSQPAAQAGNEMGADQGITDDDVPF